MPYFRLMGALLLLGCGICLGKLCLELECRRLRQAEGFLAVLRTVRLQIDCFSTPISEILQGLDGALLADCGTASPPADFLALLEGTHLYLSPEICRLLRSFGEQLGGGRKEEQLRCCDHYIARLMPYCDELQRDLPRRQRSAFLLPVFGAAAAALLLL